MPGPDGEGHHGQLSQDERGEADGHDVQEVLLEQEQRPEHDHPALVNGDQDPDEEGLVGQTPALSELLVELGIGHGHLARDVPVEAQREHGQLRVDRGVADHQEPGVQGHAAEVEHGGEDGLHGGDDQAPVDDELGQAGGLLVAVSAVHQQQPPDVAKLGHGEV